VFENVLGQNAVNQLICDIEAGVLAPAMLFSGPPASGKGTAALELGRVISCEAKPSEGKVFVRAPWGCGCPSCSRHRFLIHPDLICLGQRSFSAEIAASAGTFLRDSGSLPARMLFVRSIRKLLSRFNQVLWEDDPKRSKISPLVYSLEEDLDELDLLTKTEASPENLEPVKKLIEGTKKNAFKLESEGISETIPIAQIRRAAFWGRLAPTGRGKLLVIENADRMQDESRNSLLKLLEEPPGRLTLALTSSRPGSLLPTMLSRLRPYRFGDRPANVEEDVIRRVFRDEVKAPQGISAYLDSFLPVSLETLDALAAFFATSVSYKAAFLCKKEGRSLPEEVVLLGKYCAPIAEESGLGRPKADSAAVVNIILEKAEKFEIRSLFSRFLNRLLFNVTLSQKQPSSAGSDSFLPSVAYNEVWKKNTDWAESAVAVYNLRPVQALEKLFTDLSRGMAEL